jgi:hypothetical protein
MTDEEKHAWAAAIIEEMRRRIGERRRVVGED